MAQLGFRTLKEMVGQTHKINAAKAINHYKAKGLDLSAILHRPDGYKSMTVCNTETQDHNLDNVLDVDILKAVQLALNSKKSITLQYDINNTNRSLGAILSNEISKKHGFIGLPKDTLNLNFKGSCRFQLPGLPFSRRFKQSRFCA